MHSEGRGVRLALYCAAAAYGLTYWYHPAHDPDLGWHLLGGAWISQTGRVPLADFINAFNPYWHDYHWLAQLALYQLYRLGSYELLRAALGVLMALLASVVMSVILMRQPRHPPVLLVLALFLGAMELIGAVTAVRPQMISVFLTALVLHRLLHARTWWELPYLFALTVVMANMHIYWIFSPLLWGLYRCLPRLFRRRSPPALYAWGGLALLAASAMVSPYGLLAREPVPSPAMNYALAWELFTTSPELKAQINEFKSGLAADGIIPLMIVAYVAFLVRTFRRRRFAADLPSGLGAWAGAALAINSLKFVSMLAVFGLPYVSRAAGAAWRRLRVSSALRATWLEAALLFALSTWSVVHAAQHFPWTAPNNEYIDIWQPVAACRRIPHLDLAPSPHAHYRVFTHFAHGGWCRWAIYEENPEADFRVTTDGRTQSVPPQHYFDAYELGAAKATSLATLRRWDPDVLVLAKSAGLATVLRIVPQEYPLVFEDENFVVFKRAR